MRRIGFALAAAWMACGLAAAAQAVPITIYEDTNSSGSYDTGEERTGGVNADPGATYNYAFDLDAGVHDIAGASIDVSFDVWDNNFILIVNGVTVVPVDNNDPAVFTPAIQTPWTANSNGLPRLHILLDESAISFEAALTTSATSLTAGLVYAQPTTNPVFVDGQNTIAIVNPDGPGPDSLDFSIFGDVPLLAPEPGTGALLGLGLAGLALARRRAGRLRP